MSVEKTTSKTRSRFNFLMVLGAFVFPLVLAIGLYARLDLWTPPGGVNHGQLLDPVHPLEMLELQGVNEQPITLEDIKDVWTLAYIGEGDCSITCQTDLFKMRQVRAMLGRDLVRVNSMYVALDDSAFDSVVTISEQYPNLKIGLSSKKSVESQKQAFDKNPEGDFFLLDPLGNVVLRYDDETTTKGLLKDLKRLLKVSQIG